MKKRVVGGAACALLLSVGFARAQSVAYRLNPGSFYELGCHGGCTCPILVHAPMTGTFLLTAQPPDPLFAVYSVSAVQWSSDGHIITGAGTYRIGGEVAVEQQMVLDVSVDGVSKHLESGFGVVQGAWPDIVITVTNQAQSPLCYDTVMHIEASPLPRHCSADFNNDGNVGTDADIEAFFACLSGSCCAMCGDADFNGDGDVGTDADIESFFRVLAGGAC